MGTDGSERGGPGTGGGSLFLGRRGTRVALGWCTGRRDERSEVGEAAAAAAASAAAVGRS